MRFHIFILFIFILFIFIVIEKFNQLKSKFTKCKSYLQLIVKIYNLIKNKIPDILCTKKFYALLCPFFLQLNRFCEWDKSFYRKPKHPFLQNL